METFLRCSAREFGIVKEVPRPSWQTIPLDAKGLSNFDLCGIWVTCSSAKRRACDCECPEFLLGRRRAELESPTLVLDCICTLCSREVHRDAAESSATVRPHQVPRVTGTESLVDIQVRSQRNPHKTLLCSSTPRVLVQPGYPTRGSVGFLVCSRRSVSGTSVALSAPFSGLLGFSWWALVGTFSAPPAPSLVWVVVGRSLWSACRAVPLLCLSACLRFALCVPCGACARSVALVLRGPWAVVLLGLCAVPLWVFSFRVFRKFSGDAGAR